MVQNGLVHAVEFRWRLKGEVLANVSTVTALGVSSVTDGHCVSRLVA